MPVRGERCDRPFRAPDFVPHADRDDAPDRQLAQVDPGGQGHVVCPPLQPIHDQVAPVLELVGQPLGRNTPHHRLGRCRGVKEGELAPLSAKCALHP